MSEEKCPKCNELKSVCKCEPKNDDKSTTQVRDVSITIDPKNMEEILRRLKDEEKKSEDLGKELKKAMEDKKTAETSLEEEKTTKEDYENKLKIIAEQKFTEKKGIIMGEAKKLGLDDARLKQIEEGLKTPEDLKQTEFLVQTLAESLAKGAEDHKKLEKKEGDELEGNKGAAGSVSLRPEDVEKENTGSGEVSYESHAAMIRDLRKKSHSAVPEEAAEAKSILAELFKKWAGAVKKQYEGKAQGGLGEIGPKDIKEQPSLKDITKKGGEVV